MQIRPAQRHSLFKLADKLFHLRTTITPTDLMLDATFDISYGVACSILNTLVRNGRAREIQPGRFIRTAI